jgi:hypothetical protein
MCPSDLIVHLSRLPEFTSVLLYSKFYVDVVCLNLSIAPYGTILRNFHITILLNADSSHSRGSYRIRDT